MKLEIPVEVDLNGIDSIVDEIKCLQTYKLSEGDDMVLVNLDDVAEILINHIEAKRKSEPQRMRGKGRWNAYYHGEENGKSIFSYSCNKCGYGAPYNFIGGVCEQKKWNFCPNCGADMRGTE